MIIVKFEDIIAWQNAHRLTLSIYPNMHLCKDWGFRDQICRASVSIMNNVAEGYERKSNKEFIQFLYIAKGSCAEVRSMLYLAIELKYIQKSTGESLIKLSEGTSQLISAFIKVL